MFNRIFMQVKRECWENNKLIFKAPSYLALGLVSLLIVAMCYIALADNSFTVRDNGKLTFTVFTSDYQKNDDVIANTQWFFSSNEQADKASMQQVQYDFALPSDANKSELAAKSKENSVMNASTRSKNFSLISFPHKEIGIQFFFIIVAVIVLSNGMNRDRKDGSIYFWRSLPVSETQNVLTKLFIATIALPFVYSAIFLATHLISLALISIFQWAVIPVHFHVLSFAESFAQTCANAGALFLLTLYAMFLALPLLGLVLASSAFFNRFGESLVGFAIIFTAVLEEIIYDHSYIMQGIKFYYHTALHAIEVMRAEQVFYSEITSLWPFFVLGICLIGASIFIRRWKIDTV